jgi:hypothetical protein
MRFAKILSAASMISESGTEAKPLAASRTKFVLKVSGILQSAPQSDRILNDFVEYFMSSILQRFTGGLPATLAGPRRSRALKEGSGINGGDPDKGRRPFIRATRP